MQQRVDTEALGQLVRSAKKLAKQYRKLTGKPLGITGEVGEYEAARLLGLKLCPARQSGFDATRGRGKSMKRIQIKSRCILPDAKSGQRVGSIRLDHEWDSVALVLLDENFEPTEIYEAERKAIEKAINKPGSKARNKRGSLGVSKFKSIGKRVWPKGSKPNAKRKR